MYMVIWNYQFRKKKKRKLVRGKISKFCSRKNYILKEMTKK